MPGNGHDTYTVHIAGDIDCSTVDVWRRILTDTIRTTRADITADLGDVTFAGSDAVRLLLWLRDELEADGRLLIIRRTPRHVHRVLDALGLRGQFTYDERP
jgi:anti-anti-sigma factor